MPRGQDESLFIAWSTGHTGFPMVDACMRCLNETGYHTLHIYNPTTQRLPEVLERFTKI
ncbi:MAG: FAD-binding domain-containing protein [Saprospiraceae bacterium]